MSFLNVVANQRLVYQLQAVVKFSLRAENGIKHRQAG